MTATNIAAGMIGLLVTVLLEIPRHDRLEKAGKNDSVIAELVRYNWPRTLSISAQSVIALLMLRHIFEATLTGDRGTSREVGDRLWRPRARGALRRAGADAAKD